MGVKKFTAATMQKALKQIRAELGDDAIIVSNRKLANGQIEISVSVDDGPEQGYAPAPTASAPAAPQRSMSPEVEPLNLSNEKAKQLLAAVRTSQQNRDTFEKPSQQQYVNQPPSQPQSQEMSQIIQSAVQSSMQAQLQATVMQLQEEIHMLKRGMQAQEQPAQSQSKKPKAHAPEPPAIEPLQSVETRPVQNKKAQVSVLKKWRHMGVSQTLFRDFLQSNDYSAVAHESEATVWKTSLEFLKQRLTRYSRNPVEAPGVYAFVGPTGAGKTTTLAKLAVRQVNRWGSDQVGIVTMDSFRIGAWEQMQRLGDIIGVETALCRQEDSLLDTLSSMRHCRSLLIDTAGLSHQDERRLVQWQKLAELGDELETFLVAPVNLQSRVLDQLTQAYKPAQARGMIYTKCDELTSLGEAVSSLIQARLPWVFACDGQKIPDDLKAMTVESVVQMLLKTSQQKGWKLGGHASEQETLLVKAMGE